MKDIQDRVKRASNDVNTVLQPRVAQAKRSLEQSIQQIGLKAGPEIFQDDKPLYIALTDLDNVREMISTLSKTVEQHRTSLLDVARCQSSLSSQLLNITPPPTISTTTEPANNVILTEGRMNAQIALSKAESQSAKSISRFALDMSTPMADLSRTFEETLTSKITPLRRRYLSQKREYLNFSKQAADAENEDRRRHLAAIANSTCWKSTSDTLLAEIKSLIVYTISRFSEWSLNVSQAQHEMFTFSASAFKQPAALAEAAENENENENNPSL